MKYQISLIVSTKKIHRWCDGWFHWFCSLILYSIGWRFRFIFIWPVTFGTMLCPFNAQIIHKPFISINIPFVDLFLPSGCTFFICLISGVQCSNSRLSALFARRKQHSFQSFLKTKQKTKTYTEILLLFNIWISGTGQWLNKGNLE